MADKMDFPDTVEEFMEQYKVVDADGVYMSKGSELIPIFRMRQWFEHLPSVQPEKAQLSGEDATLDCISRIAVYDRVDRIVNVNHLDPELAWFTPIGVKALIAELPSAQPEQNAYEQGRIVGRVEMRTEILNALKDIVGSEVWDNV